MRWFKKDIQEPKQHECIMKDFPWYMEVHYNGSNKTASYEIIEPYVCISGCGKRIDKVLESDSWTHISTNEREKEYNQIRQRYKKYLKPRAVVEDMINNVLLVKDPGRLNMVEKMYGLPHQNCGTSAEMEFSKKEDNFKIKLPERDKNEMDSR